MRHLKKALLYTVLFHFMLCFAVSAIPAAAKSTEAPIYIFIEGLVGCGKTTITRLIKQHFPYTHIVYEPLEKWLDVEGKGNLYDMFLKDTPRWAFTAEFYVPFARATTLEQKAKSTNKPVVIIDRSMYMDRYCFAKTIYNMGAMNPLEWEIYTKWFEWFMKHFSIKPDGFIYLQTNVQTTLKRIQKRDRIEEQDYPVDLQKKFHRCFEEFFIQKIDFPKELADVPILTLNANEDFEHNHSVQKQYLANIKTFIQNLLEK